jgi:hypothetical protein
MWDPFDEVGGESVRGFAEGGNRRGMLVENREESCCCSGRNRGRLRTTRLDIGHENRETARITVNGDKLDCISGLVFQIYESWGMIEWPTARGACIIDRLS